MAYITNTGKAGYTVNLKDTNAPTLIRPGATVEGELIESAGTKARVEDGRLVVEKTRKAAEKAAEGAKEEGGA